MLRTLGYQKKQLAALLNLQSLFFSVPATVLGVGVMLLLLYIVKIVIYETMKVPILTEIDNFTILVVSL
jgi:ABC-type antimicrobial peptide transport system permease subunit